MENMINYSKMSTATEVTVPETNVETTIDVTSEPEVTPAVEEVKTGTVIGCSRLNIRKAPNANAKILATINKGEIVNICDEVGDFYKIGDKEYCMKKYISINQ